MQKLIFSGMRNKPAKELGARIRRRREAVGLSQEKLADLAKLHRTYVGAVERGERNISLFNILRLAEALKEDPGNLLGGLRL